MRKRECLDDPAWSKNLACVEARRGRNGETSIAPSGPPLLANPRSYDFEGRDGATRQKKVRLGFTGAIYSCKIGITFNHFDANRMHAGFLNNLRR